MSARDRVVFDGVLIQLHHSRPVGVPLKRPYRDAMRQFFKLRYFALDMARPSYEFLDLVREVYRIHREYMADSCYATPAQDADIKARLDSLLAIANVQSMEWLGRGWRL